MSSYDITAILNVHNEGVLLKHTVQSFASAIHYARASRLSVEGIIVVDRPDAITLEVLSELTLFDFRTIMVDCGDLGCSRNAGINAASGKWIAFLDGDDLWGKNWLERAYAMGESDPRCLILHPYLNLYFSPQKTWLFYHVDMEDAVFDFRVLFSENYWTSLSFARRETYLKHPYTRNDLKERIGFEDWTWNCRTVSADFIHKTVPNTMHFIRRKRESLLIDTVTNKALPAAHPLLQKYLRIKDANYLRAGRR